MNRPPCLNIVIPCYNEEAVLPLTYPMFESKLEHLVRTNKVSSESKVLFVDDGSNDGTWRIISELCEKKAAFRGIKLSRNRGHQNALLCGLMEARRLSDVTISIDCDGQDDIDAMDAMIDAYSKGFDIVYGVRSSRDTDTGFKRGTAQAFYRIMEKMGVETIYNHADYRLMSSRSLDALAEFKEVNLFLRGMVPLVGFESTCVYYERHERAAGESHYPLSKMLALAINGITSLSVKPIRLITGFGFAVSLVSFVAVIWAIAASLTGNAVAGWASITSILCFLLGVLLLSVGVIGEYIGKIYLEVKARPRYIVENRTWENNARPSQPSVDLGQAPTKQDGKQKGSDDLEQ